MRGKSNLKDNIKDLEIIEDVLEIDEKDGEIEISYAGEPKYHFKEPEAAYKGLKKHKGISCSIRVGITGRGYKMYCEECKEEIIRWEKSKRVYDPTSLFNIGLVRDTKGMEHKLEAVKVYVAMYLQKKYGGKLMVTKNEITQETDYWVVIAGKKAINQRGEVLDLDTIRIHGTIRIVIGPIEREQMEELLDKEGIMYEDKVVIDGVQRNIEKEKIHFKIEGKEGKTTITEEYKEEGGKIKIQDGKCLDIEAVSKIVIERVDRDARKNG